ncbi:MAG: hypothetical protein J5I93_03805 [Pirellulaceae bacterium]|nr:hypothetical protein [Pirellulaceae bacterium]
METSLHRQLKAEYAGPDARTEVPLGRYRIDVVTADRLVEIQHGSLAAIRDKIRHLLRRHQVTVVKPIITRKVLVRLAARGGPVVSRRASPKRGRLLDLFDELVYFTRVYPHPNLALDVPLVEIEEYRFPGHGRRRRWRESDFLIEDQQLLRVADVHRFRTAADLLRIIPGPLPQPFHTGQLAAALDAPRWVAQRAAYCLRAAGAIQPAGKQRNAVLYVVTPPAAKRQRRRRA